MALNDPKITLITTVRNGAAFIERCLQSVVDQQYPNLEFIVLDAASTDGTQAIIGRYIQHISFYRSEKDNGPYEALTFGCRMATGHLVGFLMADDWLSPDALATLAQMYHAQPEAQVYCFGMQEHKLEADGSYVPTRWFCDPPGDCFTVRDGLYCQGVNRFYARPLVQEPVLYRTEPYPNLADREFYVRLGFRNLHKAWTDKILYHFLTHPGSNSTGGTAQKTVKFLEETAAMAADLQQREGISPAQRCQLKNWYCFNMLRAIYFRCKYDPASAVVGAMKLFLRYPLRSIKNLLCWKMPRPYRARIS